MTIPLIVLLVALGLVSICMVAIAEREGSIVLPFAGVVLAAAAFATAMAFFGLHSDGPACRLAPSSLVERAP